MKNTILLISFVLSMLITACSPTPFPVAAPDVAQNGIEIYNARVPVPVGLMADNSNMEMQMEMSLAGFMVIKNTSETDDRLLSVSADFADASMHQTKSEGDIVQMFAVPTIDIPAGQMVEFKSGGYHVMLMNPTAELKVGETVNLVLEFEKAGTITVPARVVEQ